MTTTEQLEQLHVDAHRALEEFVLNSLDRDLEPSCDIWRDLTSREKCGRPASWISRCRKGGCIGFLCDMHYTRALVLNSIVFGGAWMCAECGGTAPKLLELFEYTPLRGAR